MARKLGIQEVGPDRYVLQVQVKRLRKTKRFSGTLDEAKLAHAQLHAELLAQWQMEAMNSNNGLPGPRVLSRCPTLTEWLTGRYAQHQKLAQNECTRRKLESPARYLLASDLAELPLDKIDTGKINHHIEWRREVGALTFAYRNDGERYKPRRTEVGNQTVNKALKLLSSALRLAHEEGTIDKLPRINFLPEDDARAIVPPTEEQYQALIRGAQGLRAIAPFLPEVVELFGEFGLRPGELFHLTWGSVDWKLGVGENQGALRIEEQKRTRVVGGKPWLPKNRKFRWVPFTSRGREILEQLRGQQKDAAADELVIPNENGLPYIRFDAGTMKGGGTSVWKRLLEVSFVEGVAMRDLRHYFAVQNLIRGVPLTMLSHWMGHSHIELTAKRYGRWAREQKEQWEYAMLRSKSAEVVETRPRHLRPVP